MTVPLRIPAPVRFGTRRSPLARWQTQRVIALARAAAPEATFDEVIFDTEGDRRLDVPLPEVGGKGLFTEALEHALREGAVDAAVHSLKDLPTGDPEGLTLGAVLDRADVRDALVAPRHGGLAALPQGAVVGTSSLRRAAQLRRVRPDLTIRSIRGNVGTRLQKVDEGHYDAAVFACAGLERLGLTDRITERLPLDVMLPAPGQGALAVQARAGDAAMESLLARLDAPAVRAATHAERAFLAALGGGCAAPVAAYATVAGGVIALRARVLGLDGQAMIEATAGGADADIVAQELAATVRRAGADALLAAARQMPLPG
jgi:hydroxymethylbilane synthase